MGIRVLLVDDQILFRQGIKSLLSAEQGIQIVGDIGSRSDELEKVSELSPDVIVIDVSPSHGDGIHTIEVVKRQCSNVRILVLTDNSDYGLFRQAATAGVDGYVLKDISPRNLVHAIRAVYQGKTMINPDLSKQILAHLTNHDMPRQRTYGMTERDVEVLAMVARGLSDKEIAQKLGVSESTVKSHLRTIYRRLQVRNRAQAVAFAVEKHLLDM
jgi:DNA-binding NarL/FixJ family response regulator